MTRAPSCRKSTSVNSVQSMQTWKSGPEETMNDNGVFGVNSPHSFYFRQSQHSARKESQWGKKDPS